MALLQHDQFCQKNRQPFVSKCFEHEQLFLDLVHLETPIQSTVVYFPAQTHRSMIRLPITILYKVKGHIMKQRPNL